MKEITAELLHGVLQEPVVQVYTQEEERAFKRIQSWILVRERSSLECKNRLIQEGFRKKDASTAVKRACDCGLLDDIRYADALIRTRLRKGKGKELIRKELAALHLTFEDVPGWPQDFDTFSAQDEIQRARCVLEKHPIRAKDKKAAAYRRLVSKGFSHNVAIQVAQSFNYL